jgi:hypothetical protein
MRRPVGNTDPVTAPQASRKFSRIGVRTQGITRFMDSMIGAGIAKVNCIFKIN